LAGPSTNSGKAGGSKGIGDTKRGGAFTLGGVLKDGRLGTGNGVAFSNDNFAGAATGCATEAA
jgi:hypothetical protein